MIITLTGTNSYVIKQHIDALIAQFREKHGTFGVEQVSGETIAREQLAALLQGGSLFAAERLVILREASAQKDVAEAISESLAAIPSEVTVVFVEPNLDKRTKLYKQLKKYSDFRELQDLDGHQLVAWLQQQASQLQATLDAKTARFLLQQLDTDQWQLNQELQKLANYNKEITVDTVRLLVEPTTQATAFDVLDAALAGKTTVLEQLLQRVAQNEDPYRFLGLLISQLYAVAVVQSAGNRTVETIAREAGLHPFVVRKSQALARNLTLKQLQSMLDAVVTCDQQLKSTGAEPWLLIKQCLGKVASPLRAA